MTWILLRGLSREAAHWGTFPAVLAAGLDGAQVVTIDLPGAGVLNHARSPVRIDDFVDACRREAVRVGARAPFSLVALSLGAVVAVAWAHRFAEEVQRCVLINTSLRPFAPFYRRLRPARYFAVLRALIADDLLARERVVLELTGARPAEQAGAIESWVRIARERPVTRTNALRQLWAAARYRAPAQRPRCELLLLASRADRLVDVRCSRAIAARWGVPLIEHAWGGHDLALDDPQWIIAQLRAWLASTTVPTRGVRSSAAPMTTR